MYVIDIPGIATWGKLSENSSMPVYEIVVGDVFGFFSSNVRNKLRAFGVTYRLFALRCSKIGQ